MIPIPIQERFATAAEQALLEGSLSLPEDVVAALEKASLREEDPVARAELATMLENLSEAERLKVPICQDTGTPVFYVTLPNGFVFTDEIYTGISEGVRRATTSIPLRPQLSGSLYTGELWGQSRQRPTGSTYQTWPPL